MLALLVSGLALAAALVLVVVLIARHVPAGGLRAWLKESFGSWNGRRDLAEMREESVHLAETMPHDADFGVADILDMAEPGPAYHRPVDLVEVVGSRHKR